MPVLIGFGYKASSGKDTAALYVEDKYGFYKTALASNLKDCLKNVFLLSDWQVNTTVGKETPFLIPIVYDINLHNAVLEWMCESSGIIYTDYDIPRFVGTILYTPRHLLQFVGTDVIRSYDDKYHLKVCLDQKRVSESNTVISDIRFPNEADGVLDRGGFCVALERSNAFLDSKYSNHKSETSMVGWNKWFKIIDNNTTFTNLYAYLDSLVEEIQNGCNYSKKK